jgi:hypothetical protein
LCAIARDTDLNSIATALLGNATTTALDLGFGNFIQDKDLAPLLELLKTNTTLREIRLDGNSLVSHEMKQQIEAALQRNRDLSPADAGSRGDVKQGIAFLADRSPVLTHMCSAVCFSASFVRLSRYVGGQARARV